MADILSLSQCVNPYCHGIIPAKAPVNFPGDQGRVSIFIYCLTSVGISIIQIRRSHDLCIFVMEGNTRIWKSSD